MVHDRCSGTGDGRQPELVVRRCPAAAIASMLSALTTLRHGFEVFAFTRSFDPPMWQGMAPGWQTSLFSTVWRTTWTSHLMPFPDPAPLVPIRNRGFTLFAVRLSEAAEELWSYKSSVPENLRSVQ
jgi:hypothetical protein